MFRTTEVRWSCPRLMDKMDKMDEIGHAIDKHNRLTSTIYSARQPRGLDELSAVLCAVRGAPWSAMTNVLSLLQFS